MQLPTIFLLALTSFGMIHAQEGAAPKGVPSGLPKGGLSKGGIPKSGFPKGKSMEGWYAIYITCFRLLLIIY